VGWIFYSTVLFRTHSTARADTLLTGIVLIVGECGGKVYSVHPAPKIVDRHVTVHISQAKDEATTP
jgi:hypothetical protein